MTKVWTQNQENEIKFVLIDANGLEVVGLGTAFSIEISKPGNEAFVAGVGEKSEIGDGWYRYVATVEESNELGAIAVKVAAAGALQQNLVYEIKPAALTAAQVWQHSVRTLTSPTGQTQGPIVIPATNWSPP